MATEAPPTGEYPVRETRNLRSLCHWERRSALVTCMGEARQLRPGDASVYNRLGQELQMHSTFVSGQLLPNAHMNCQT